MKITKSNYRYLQFIDIFRFADIETIRTNRDKIITFAKQNQLKNRAMRRVREICGLKCPNHDYVRDNYNFMYEELYIGARPLPSSRCFRCGKTMSLHKTQK